MAQFSETQLSCILAKKLRNIEAAAWNSVAVPSQFHSALHRHAYTSLYLSELTSCPSVC